MFVSCEESEAVTTSWVCSLWRNLYFRIRLLFYEDEQNSWGKGHMLGPLWRTQQPFWCCLGKEGMRCWEWNCSKLHASVIIFSLEQIGYSSGQMIFLKCYFAYLRIKFSTCVSLVLFCFNCLLEAHHKFLGAPLKKCTYITSDCRRGFYTHIFYITWETWENPNMWHW